ncbi:MAG: LamG-like jellyroll fold domain-containing protein [Planctomycetota bacterium]
METPLAFDGTRDDAFEVAHTAAMELDEGTLAVAFTLEDVADRQTLFSKDHSGYQDGGHLTAWVVGGRVEVRFQSDTRSIHLRSAIDSIQADETHQVAVSFGDDGARLYVDGLIADAAVDFEQDLSANGNPLVLGASAARRDGDRANLREPLSGVIESFAVYDSAIGYEGAATLAGIDQGPRTGVGVVDATVVGSDNGEWIFASQHDSDDIHSGYGDDLLIGDGAANRLDGGHGEDILSGGPGDDLLVSRSDGREPVIAQDYSGEDPRNEVNAATGTIYPDQPIASDDFLIGGDGADTFRFEILINAKERILFKHVEDDGTIDWKGVTGENNDVHDHWVDRIGDEVIMDFDRSEGDKIEIVGHTVDVYRVTHLDSDRDGVLDSSVMYLQSNQGNAGAHNKDQLGTITVYGDLVLKSDYHVNAHANLGIVETIGELPEALAPRFGMPVVTDGESRWARDQLNEGALPDGAVFSAGQDLVFSGDREDYVEVEHSRAFDLDEGAFAVTFSVDEIDGRQTLFSKDHSGYEDGGHLTAWVDGDRVKVRLQSDSRSVTLASAEGSVLPGHEHQVVVSFGGDGFKLFVDGLTADANADFTQGIAENDSRSLVLGVSSAGRDGDRLNARDPLAGVLSEFVVYDEQVDLYRAAELAGLVDTPLTEPTVIEGVLTGTDGDDDLTGSAVNGEYGDDVVNGTPGADVLDGGHGEDQLFGGAGDDLLISRSDGREPVIAQDYSGEDPRNEVNAATGTIYPDQPIASDDSLTGGEGADTFRFEILVNAKERILYKHINDDGTIDWKGVTGENDDVHDHWVDRIGDEVITDFNRAEGDKIEVVGHTVDVYKVEHLDSDGDGVLDASRMYVQSNQGNAGAHNKDQLGTITVYGDLVLRSDYHVHAHANLGIVETIGELGEALAPRFGTPVVTDGESRWLFDEVDEAPLPEGAVFAVGQGLAFNGDRDDYVNIAHTPALELDNGTVAIAFSVDDATTKQTLFSKDHREYQDGGHLTAWVNDGRVEVRLQSDSRSVHLRSAIGSIMPGQEHHVAVSFGDEGVRLFVDGLIADGKADFTQGIAPNENSLVIGGSTTNRSGDRLNINDPLAGEVTEFAIYDSQLGLAEVAGLAGLDLARPTEALVIEGVLTGTDADETLAGSAIDGGYGDDEVTGTAGADVLDGGHGEDIVNGGAGNDLIVSRSDGREPIIAQDYSDEDPRGEVNDATRTLYPDQPIAGDDLLIGGEGADTFRFEILINAKERILFKHVEDDGTIDWKGVTGENNDVHDHWVDRIGDDVIMDFSRAEGDKIAFVGHTVDVYKVEHVDSDGDGVLDATKMYVQSNQGNAGAHNKDQLGVVTVYGDLVREADYHVHAHANLGIVETIGELAEALAPYQGETIVPDGESRWLLDEVDEAPLPDGAVFAVGQELSFSGDRDDLVNVAHSAAMKLDSGTIAVAFTADDTTSRQALFSKDHRTYQDGGHLTAWIVDGRIEVRFQSDSRSVHLRSEVGSVEPGVRQAVEIGFGEGGAMLYLNGELVDSQLDFTQGIAPNDNSLVIGASTARRDGDRLNAREPLTGVVHELAIYGAAPAAISATDEAFGTLA